MNTANEEKMNVWEEARSVPENMRRPIKEGKLSGMTNINPVFRLKRLTEMFGPCGIGWWFEVTETSMHTVEDSNETCISAKVLLYYMLNGIVSKGIPGFGGAMFVTNKDDGKHYVNDDCFKIAVTDALSNAARNIGVAADVYLYGKHTEATTSELPKGKVPNFEEALRFVVPMGKYKGKAIGDLLEENRKQVEWYASDTSFVKSCPEVAVNARVALGQKIA